MTEAQVHVAAAQRELDVARRAGVGPALDDLLQVSLRRIDERGYGADVERQRVSRRDVIDLAVGLPDASRKDNVHLP